MQKREFTHRERSQNLRGQVDAVDETNIKISWSMPSFKTLVLCPMPIIEIRHKIDDLNEGEILEVIATDEGIKEDAAAWCKSMGHQLLGIEEEGDQKIFRVYIRK